jgi:hypothetical protein
MGGGSVDGLAHSNLLLAALDQHRQQQQPQQPQPQQPQPQQPQQPHGIPPPHGMRSTSLHAPHGYGYGSMGGGGGGGYGVASSFLGQSGGGGQFGSSGRSLTMAATATAPAQPNLDAVSERGGPDGEHALAESEPRWAPAPPPIVLGGGGGGGGDSSPGGGGSPRGVVGGVVGGGAVDLRGEAEELRELEALEREEAAQGGSQALARSERFAARRGQLLAHLLNAQLDSAEREGRF